MYIYVHIGDSSCIDFDQYIPMIVGMYWSKRFTKTPIITSDL